MVINWHTSEESSFIDVDTCSGKFGLEYGRLQIDGDNGFKSEIDLQRSIQYQGRTGRSLSDRRHKKVKTKSHLRTTNFR
jgi:hypothetical protein